MAGGGGGKGGKGGGGGGSGSIDINSTSTNTVDSDSTANINSTSNSTATVNSTSTNNLDSNATAELRVAGLDNIRLKADTTADSKTQLEMDLKPLQIDLCFKVGLERFPSTKICKPLNRHFGITLLGVEVLAFNYVTDDKTIIEDLGNRPFVVADSGNYKHAAHDYGPVPQGVRIRLPT